MTPEESQIYFDKQIDWEVDLQRSIIPENIIQEVTLALKERWEKNPDLYQDFQYPELAASVLLKVFDRRHFDREKEQLDIKVKV